MNNINKRIINPKKLWDSINEVIYNLPRSNSSTAIPPIKFNNTKITDSKHKANILNEFFINVSCTNPAPSLTSSHAPISNMSLKYHPMNSFQPTTPQEVNEIILSLETNTSAGYDGIKAAFVKRNVNFFSKLLSDNFNVCFKEGIFPDSLKIAKVVPIHKSGSKDDPNNYRPISLLSIFSKIFEILIRNRLDFFLCSNKIIDENQFGFLKKSSTSSAATNLVNELSIRMNQKLKTSCLFVDLRKAFDCLDYASLRSILHNIGIRYLI